MCPMVITPGIVPVCFGLNVTNNVHLPRAGIEAPQGPVPPAATAYCPLTRGAEIASGTAWLLVKVVVFGLLVVPTTCPGNVTLVGEKVKGKTPAPVRLRICVLAAPVINATEPLNKPATAGLKPIVMVQLAPAPKAPMHGLAPLPVTLYPLLAAMLVIVIVDPLAFVAVTVFPGETLPARVEPKVKLAGENISGEVLAPEPTPLRLTS